jgi:glycosyltransferase involved in cell wall biosynthesis
MTQSDPAPAVKVSGLRVLQLSHDYEGPFASVCRQYNEAFSNCHVTTIYLRGESSPEVTRSTGGDEVLYFEQPPLRGIKLSGILQLAAVFRAQKFDIVIAHRYKPIYLAGLMSYFFGIKVILGVAHEHDVFKRITRALFVTFWRRNIFVVAVSASVARNIAAHCPSLTGNRLAVLGHAIAEHEFLSAQNARAKLQLPDGFVFGCVGRLVRKKRHHVLIEAFAAASMGPSVVLAVVGAGPLEASLRELCSALEVEERVLFLGHVDDAVINYHAFNALVLPSGNEEAFGLVLVEAMQAGLPVLASDADAQKEVLGDTGIHFVQDDVSDLASKLQWMLSLTDSQRAVLSAASRQRYESNFTMARFVDNLHQLPPIARLADG